VAPHSLIIGESGFSSLKSAGLDELLAKKAPRRPQEGLTGVAAVGAGIYKDDLNHSFGSIMMVMDAVDPKLPIEANDKLSALRIRILLSEKDRRVKFNLEPGKGRSP